MSPIMFKIYLPSIDKLVMQTVEKIIYFLEVDISPLGEHSELSGSLKLSATKFSFYSLPKCPFKITPSFVLHVWRS
jgi:hypothetical protein